MPPKFYLWLEYYSSLRFGGVALFQPDEGRVLAEPFAIYSKSLG